MEGEVEISGDWGGAGEVTLTFLTVIANAPLCSCEGTVSTEF